MNHLRGDQGGSQGPYGRDWRTGTSSLIEPTHPPSKEAPVSATPQTIVLIHGFWVTPRSWEKWIAHYEAKGHRVVAPAYPGFEVEVEALRADPTPIERVTVPAILDHLEAVIADLDALPILIGHSAGGTYAQLLLDRGHCAAAVALNSAPTEGVRVVPLSQVRSTFEVLKNPANRHKAVGFSFEQWNYAFTNTFPEDQARATYERYHIPAPGALVWNTVLDNLQPGPQDTAVDYRRDDRAPLLFVSGSEDHIMPPSIQRSNAKHYKSESTVTEVKEYEGYAHLLPAQEGWERIADDVLEWAIAHARQTSAA